MKTQEEILTLSTEPADSKMFYDIMDMFCINQYSWQQRKLYEVVLERFKKLCKF